MSINHLNIQNKQTGDKLSATEFNSTTSKINEVVDGVNASATGGKIGSNGTPLTKDSSGRIIIPLATSSSSGAMSASDKSKLDSINPSGGTGDYVDSISNEANYTANDMYDTTSEFYGTNHKINTRSISYTTSDGSTHTFTHLDTVYKPATASTTINGQTISGKAGLLSPQDKQKLDMMPRPSDITSALSGKADKQIVVLVTRTQQGSTYVYSASKTFDEISTAIGNGTNVILQYDGNYYHISYSTRDYIVFTRFTDDAYMYSSIEVSSHDEWSYSSFILQEELTIDSTPTNGSSNPVSSGGVYNALRSNFKTVNGEQLQGSGNVQTQQLVHFLETNGDWTCEWVFEDMISAFSAGVSLRGVIELSGNSYFSEVTECRDNFIRFTWIIPSESGTAPYSIYNQILLVLEAQEISTGDDMVTTVIYQRFNKPILTPTDLRAVAFSGSYSDLSDTPTFKTINGNSIVGSGSVTIDTSMIPYVSQDSHADFQGYVLDEVLNYLDDYKQATLTFDSTPTSGSTNPVTSGGVFSALRYDGSSTNYVAQDDGFSDCIESLDSELANKQDTLVSGTNIKTVNNNSLLGSGNIDAKELVYGKIQGTSFYSAMRNPRSGNWTFSANAETPNEQKIYIDILTNIIYKYDADVGYVQIGGGQIKTINGQSLIGSGNVTLDTELINYDGDGNTYFAAGDSLTEGLDSMANAIDNINPNEISSVTATESTASGGNNVVTITQTNGTTTSFNVKNGIDGVDGQDGADGANGVSLGDVEIADNLTTDDATKVLSAGQGKKLYENLMLIYDALSEGAFWNGKPTLTWVSGSTFQVINNLDGVVNSNTATSVQSGGTYGGVLTASAAFDVTITMGGVDVTSLVYDSTTGAISIASVTGNIVITAVVEEQQVTIYDGYEISTDGSMITSSGKSCTDFIPIEACKLVWSAGVKGNTSNHFYICLYDASKNYIEYYNCNKGYRILDLTSHAQASNIAYVRITFATSKVGTRICYDITNGRYIFKGEDYDGRYDNFLWGKFSSPQSGATQDNILSSDDWAISDFVAIPSNCGSVTNKVGSSTAGHKSTFYDENKAYKTYYDNFPDPRTITNASIGTIWVYEKISIYIDKLDDCYIKDETNNTYLFKGFNIE